MRKRHRGVQCTDEYFCLTADCARRTRMKRGSVLMNVTGFWCRMSAQEVGGRWAMRINGK